MKPCILSLLLSIGLGLSAQQSLPRLQRQGNAVQLIVNEKPFLVLGGELGNSSASGMEYMRPVWSRLTDMHLNTVLAPVYWELIEPEEDRYNFSLVDSLVATARLHQLKLILLWFGTWKNSMSCYVPGWIKKDTRRFPRAQDKQGRDQEILTPFSESNLAADIKAFSALLQHIKETDSRSPTVIMIQVENEIGMLPEARDHCPAANEAFNRNVPHKLIRYLQHHKASLAPHLLQAWQGNGFKSNGDWEAIFGKGLATEEIFMAWHFAQFANSITEAGKKIYPLPMFVNAALNRPGLKPGDYPSGGPLPHLIDVWKAGASSIDFLSPDFYNPDFKYWNDLYTRPDNPLFIPEIRFELSVAAKVFYAMGHYQAIGFAPFSIESTDHPGEEPIGKSYAILSQLSPLISASRGKNTMEGFLVDKTGAVDTVRLGGYTFIIKHDYTLGWSPKAKDDTWPLAGGLIIQTAADAFIVAGTGIVVTFSSDQPDQSIGILEIEEGSYVNGQWSPGRRLNGDQSHQGRHLRIPVGEPGIQQLRLYRYR